MAQQIKKKFIGADQIDGSKIKMLEGEALRGVNSLGQEVELIKLSAEDKLLTQGEEIALKSQVDSALEDAKDYADEKIADLVDSAPEVLDTLKELAAALGDDPSFATTIAGQIGDLDSRVDTLESEMDDVQEDVSDLQSRVEVLESSEEVIEVDDLVSLPTIGEESKIYVTKDSNKIYRYSPEQAGGLVLPEIPSSPTLTPTVSITQSDNLQATIDAAVPGDVIFLANGTYSYAGITVNKEISLVGESQSGVLIQDSRTNSQSFFNVSANNVTLKDLTIRHVTSDTNIGHAITVSGPGFPQARLNNFRMYNVKSQYSKGGLSVRSDNFVVEGCAFEVVAGSSTRRGILHYGNGGDSFIKNNLFINATTGALRAICPTATSGTNPSDNQSGSLTIEGSTFSGNLSQFVNMDNHQGTAGDFELIVKDNVTPETNAFVVSFGGAANFGDLFSRIVLVGNTLTNNHALGLGKGVFAIDGINGLLSYRSSNLPIISKDNVLGQLVFRSGYSEAAGSTGSIVGYNNTQISQPTVELSQGGSNVPAEYIELSPSPDLSGIEAEIESLDSRLDTIEPKVSTLESEIDSAQSDILALDSRVDSLEAFGYDQIVYVAKSGLDTNSGKQHSPFLTITAAMNSITDASPTKRYAIKVMSGNYTESSGLALKPNVFVVGESMYTVRITGAVSMHSSFTGSSDHRSGFAHLTLLNSADFNWSTVTSAAGKIYCRDVQFVSTTNLYGHNNAIAQAQFSNCTFFGNLTISGINVGVFNNNICFANITLNQHPNGGMATILTAAGGYCSGTITQNASVNDFNRRSASFLRHFNSEQLILNGPSVYADVDLVSQGKQLPTISNGANLIALTPVINHDMTSQMIVPKSTNAHNMGDWGKQWFWNFGYVHASSGTDLFLISYPSSYAPDNSGKSIGIYTDGAGLQSNVDGGSISLATAATSGTGVRGKITLDAKEIDVTTKQVKNLANGTDALDAVNKSQLDAAVQFQKESKTVDSTMLSNQYVDLLFAAKANSIVMSVGRLAMVEGFDYSVSLVGGVTRITFLAPMLIPSPEALEVGDNIHFTYAK